MESEDTSSITYHDDGSKTQGTGSYSVQGVTVQGKYFPFPSLSIASETRSNLADLKLTTLALLSICSGVPQIKIWRKVDFSMTDSTIFWWMILSLRSLGQKQNRPIFCARPIQA